MVFDYLIWLIFFFIATVTQVLAYGIGVYIVWYLYKKIGEQKINNIKGDE